MYSVSVSHIFACPFPSQFNPATLPSPSPGHGARGKTLTSWLPHLTGALCDQNKVQYLKAPPNQEQLLGHLLLRAALNIHLRSRPTPCQQSPTPLVHYSVSSAGEEAQRVE